MNPEQLRMMQQMQGAPQLPKSQQQGGVKPKRVPWYDRFGWWTVALTVLAGGVLSLVFLPPFK